MILEIFFGLLNLEKRLERIGEEREECDSERRHLRTNPR